MPDFDKKRLEGPPVEAIRCMEDDERIQLLVTGMPPKDDLHANFKAVTGDVAYTPEDCTLLAEYTAKAYDGDLIKRMKID